MGGFVASVLLLYFGRIDISVFSASIAAYFSLAAMLGGLAGTAGNEAQYKKMIAPFFRYWNMAELSMAQDTRSIFGWCINGQPRKTNEMSSKEVNTYKVT